MVFSCSSCNTSLKKKQILLHRCNATFSCLTCSSEFSKTDSQNHDNCISEAEKYRGSDYKANPNENKGMDRQKAWNDLVSESLSNYQATNPLLRTAINSIKSKPNIPNKEKKFMNFVSSAPQCKRVPNAGKLIWDIIVTYKAKLDKEHEAKCEILVKNDVEIEEKIVEIVPEEANKKRKLEETRPIESEPKVKKSKKNKKEEVGDKIVTLVVVPVVDGKESPKIKTKKSKKIQTGDTNESVVAIENNVITEETNGEGKKKKKDKKKKTEELALVATEVQEVNKENVDENEPKKEKSKKKKSKKNKDVDTTEEKKVEIVETVEVSQKKEKKKKNSNKI